MKAKEKRINMSYIITFLFFIILIILFIMVNKTEKVSYASIEEKVKSNIEIKVSQAKNVDLDEIIKKNTGYKEKNEEISVRYEELEYITKYRYNENIYIGETAIAQEGRNGIQAITTKKIFDKNGKLIKEEQVSAVVTKASINKVIDIGTKKKEEPKKVERNNGKGESLSFDMALNKPSGFSLDEFKEILSDSKDKNNIFEDNAEYFYYAEEYGINGIFVAAVGIHESAWGTSKIARNKNNLFGYGAYDSNPYNGAYTFENYAESIDLVSRVFVKYYLNPKGTEIYDGQVANGKYYNGNTLSSVNKKYASDKKWANGVYKWMEYLYSKKN